MNVHVDLPLAAQLQRGSNTVIDLMIIAYAAIEQGACSV
jgi:hypothetical protein